MKRRVADLPLKLLIAALALIPGISFAEEIDAYEEFEMRCAQLSADKLYAETAECIEQLIANWPGVKDVLNNRMWLAGAYAKDRNYEKAAEVERRIIDEHPDAENIDWRYQNLAYSYMQIGDVDKQIETYLEAIAKGHDRDGGNIAALASIYEGLGEYSKSREYYELYLEKHPESDRVDQGVYLIGELHFKEGNLKEALRYFRRLPPDYRKRDASYYPSAGEWEEKLEQDVYEARAPGEIAIFVNRRLMIPAVDPILRNGRVLVPLRGVFEELGAEVAWVHEEKQALAAKDDIRISLRIGSRRPMVNGVEVVIDVPAMLVENHTFIPLRFVSESLGAAVRWEEETRTVFIETE